jgi:hypothetical protein
MNDIGYYKDNVFYPNVMYKDGLHGFFSTLSIIMIGLIRSSVPIKKIDASKCFGHYKLGHHMYKNYWPILFKDIDIHSCCEKPEEFNVWIVNQKFTINLEKFDAYIKKYFSPNYTVQNRKNQFISNYSITPSNCLAIHYRGTDKISEVKLTPVDSYIKKANEILSIEPNLKILIQTDDFHILDRLEREFPNAVYIKELPVSNSGRGVHLSPHLIKNGLDYAIDFFASILLISQCKHVITHTGNVAFWTLLYRNSYNNFTQF